MLRDSIREAIVGPVGFQKAFLLCIVLLVSMLPGRAFAYPEMVRHGYVNCTTCHVSPSGAGVLTAYGRELSREAMSASGKEGEGAFAWGVVNPPEWLNIMGIYRGLYLYQDTPKFSQGQYIQMQGDLEAAVTIQQKWIFDATAGYQEPKGADGLGDHLISRRHWVGYKATEDLMVRGGKFMPVFGLNTPDHYISTRQYLNINNEGLDGGGATYNAELDWIGEEINVTATAIFGRPDNSGLNRDTGAAFTVSRAVSDHHKIGLSYYNGSNDLRSRNVVGPWAILGFTKHLFLLGESYFQNTDPVGPAVSRWGFANYAKLDYEIIQGIHAYVSQEWFRSDFKNEGTQMDAYALGTQILPRPHFEINVSWQKRRAIGASRDFNDYAFAMFNFYL